MNKKEYRYYDFYVRAKEKEDVENDNESMKVEGYAVVFNEETDIGYFKEVIDPTALDNCDLSDVCLTYNHSEHIPIMARTKNGSLKLKVDEKGLKVTAELLDTEQNKGIYKMVKNKLLDKMSFAFSVEEESWNNETDTRRILKIDKVYDVSLVDFPAYDGTEVSARSKEKIKENLEFRKRKLKLLLKIIQGE